MEPAVLFNQKHAILDRLTFVFLLFKTYLEFYLLIFVFLPNRQPIINGQKK